MAATLKINFSKAVADTLSKSTVDEAVAAEVGALLDRLDAASVNKDRVAHNDNQIEAIARRAVGDSGLIGLVEDSIFAEAIRAAKEFAKASSAKTVTAVTA